MQNWAEVTKYIDMPKPLCSYQIMGEILIDALNRDLALQAFLKIQEAVTRVEQLLDHEYWQETVDEMCKSRLNRVFEERVMDEAIKAGERRMVQAELIKKKEFYQINFTMDE